VLMSLHNLYDRYLADVFGFTETHRYHFDAITDGLPERDVRMHLHDVEKAARDVMARMTICSQGESNPPTADQGSKGAFQTGSS